VAALAVLVGSAESVRPIGSLDELAATFELSQLSHASARFDDAELRALSARTLHQTPFEAVRDRLAALGIAGPSVEPFWAVARGNLTRLDEARDWWAVVHGEASPVVEDAAFIEAPRRVCRRNLGTPPRGALGQRRSSRRPGARAGTPFIPCAWR
jgi:glutamyl-tRNA synthetase